MARAFLLLFLLGAYLFTNGGQTVSLRWLAIFRDFERAWAGGQYAWLTFTPLWTLLVKGHCANWWGLGSSLRLVSLSFLLQFMHSHSQSYIHMPYRLGPCTIFLLIVFIPISCKPLSCKLPIYLLQIVPYLNLANYHLTNCTITSYKLSSCKLPFLNLVHYIFLALGYGVRSHCQRS